MGNEEERAPISLREAIEQGFNRVEQEEAAEAQGAAPAQEEPAPAAEAETAQQVPAQAPNPDPVPEVTGADPAQAPASGANATGGMMQFLMAQIQQLQAQNAQLAQQVQQAQGTVQEQSQLAQNAVDTAAAQPTINVPVLDFNEMQYDDDETRARKMADWQNAMVQVISDQVDRQRAGQLQPIIEDWQRNKRIAEDEAAKAEIWGDSRFAGFKDRDAQIQQIIGANKEFDGMEAKRKYLLAGLIDRGLNQSATPTAEEIANLYRNSPDAQRIIDSERARTIAERNNQIPTIQPSSGLSTANAIPDEAPKTKNDLWRRTDEIFGVR